MTELSKLLIEERPLIVLPQLAVEVGLNEAIFLQQLYWLSRKYGKEIDGYTWVYNSYEQWTEHFPFWSTRTIQRIVAKLEKRKILRTGNYNKLGVDKTKWYAIDYAHLTKRVNHVDKLSSPTGQVVQANTKENYKEKEVTSIAPNGQHPARQRSTALYAELNEKVEPKLRRELVDEVLRILGWTHLADSDQKRLMDVHHSVATAFAFGYMCTTDYTNVEGAWREDWRSKGPVLSNWNAFLSEQVESTTQPQQRTLVATGEGDM